MSTKFGTVVKLEHPFLRIIIECKLSPICILYADISISSLDMMYEIHIWKKKWIRIEILCKII